MFHLFKIQIISEAIAIRNKHDRVGSKLFQIGVKVFKKSQDLPNQFS